MQKHWHIVLQLNVAVLDHTTTANANGAALSYTATANANGAALSYNATANANSTATHTGKSLTTHTKG